MYWRHSFLCLLSDAPQSLTWAADGRPGAGSVVAALGNTWAHWLVGAYGYAFQLAFQHEKVCTTQSCSPAQRQHAPCTGVRRWRKPPVRASHTCYDDTTLLHLSLLALFSFQVDASGKVPPRSSTDARLPRGDKWHLRDRGCGRRARAGDRHKEHHGARCETCDPLVHVCLCFCVSVFRSARARACAPLPMSPPR